MSKKKDKWWEARNPDFDWEGMYKQYPDVDWNELYDSLPKELMDLGANEKGLNERADKTKKSLAEPARPNQSKNDPEFTQYKSMLSSMLHSKQTSKNIDDMLNSGLPPEQAVPEIAKQLSAQAANTFQKNKKELSTRTVVGGALFLATELVDLGRTGGFFDVTKETAMPIVEKATRAVIKDGLSQGYVDPIELQKQTNDAFGPEQAQEASAVGAKYGVPAQADETVAMEVYAKQKNQAQALAGGGQR